MSAELLPLFWTAALGLAVTLYVLLDGFSLGIGVLYPFAKDDDERDLMMASVVPVWDGNQTWLVGGGMALFTAFPKAFNLLMSVLYLPLILMVIALVFRGVAFEFRFKAKRKRVWDWAFTGGSTVAAFCQGLVLGTYIQGFNYDGRQLEIAAGGILSPFAIFTGLAVVCAYALLASCWLIMKTEGDLQDWARRSARRLMPVIVIGIAAVSLWTPYVLPHVAELWFSFPNFIVLSPIPLWTLVLILLMGWMLFRDRGREIGPFLCCIGLYLLTLAGLGVSLFPYIVPRELTIWDVAAPEGSLFFAMVGVLFIVPIILLYTAHAYYVFRGKTDIADVYH